MVNNIGVCLLCNDPVCLVRSVCGRMEQGGHSMQGLNPNLQGLEVRSHPSDPPPETRMDPSAEQAKAWRIS